MLGTPLDTRLRRVLGVTVGDDLALAFDEDASAYFPANIAVPSADNSTFEGSPRSAATPWRLTWQTAPVEMHACDRIETAYGAPGQTFELLADPRPVTNGGRTIGYSAPMLPVGVLYPRSAELRELGAAEELATVECAVFSARESTTQHGVYTDTICELPPAAWEHVQASSKNKALHFPDGSVRKLTEATLGAEVPIVTAALRKAGS